MNAPFWSRPAAVVAALGLLLAARPAHAQSAGPAPAPQPYPRAWAPYAAPPPSWGAPAWGGSPSFPVERNSSGMIASGITLITVGSVGSVIGAALLAAGTAQNDVDWTCPSEFDCFPVTTRRSAL